MEFSSKTACTRCGAGILQITADLNGGHCMPCAKALAREREPSVGYEDRHYPKPLLDHLKPEDGIILSVSYDPGWSPDSTSWVIQISGNGVLRQAMLWSQERGRKAELLDPVVLGASDLAAIRELVDGCSRETFLSLRTADCVDDVATVSLVMPAHGVKASLPYFHYEEGLKRGRREFDEAQRAAFELFGKLWHFADRHGPYRLRDHEKKGR